jgi:alpha-glucoside transport system permease protein
MQQTARPSAAVEGGLSRPLRILIGIGGLILTALVIWQGFLFVRDSAANKILIALFAIVWGVGSTMLFFFTANYLVEQFPDRIREVLTPYVFVGPAVAILIWFLAAPTVRTTYISMLDATSENFVFLQNYLSVFTQRSMWEAFRNNLLWMSVGGTLSVSFGLIIAVLADRSRFENFAKSMIFLPMAISMVGAGIIWKFIYASKPVGDPQIGLLNAIVVAMGGEPQEWIRLLQPWNNLFLIVVVIWLQTGYGMVLFSAAIKGIPAEILEAARVDGANEWQVFFQIMLPAIMPTIITVSTTVLIFTLKIFDVVMVMTGGQYGTQVVATEFYRQYFINRDFGLGSALAVVLLLAVIPVMVYNLRQFRQQEAFR